ncbi:TPA: Flp pilus assembly complex ATPase component [Escherichia coli]|nr:Flp pilus assembly complex ATPase component [Escherichia coli]HBA6952245.1 Flp pilus assembly complex ATPase component [Escherichia coli]HBA7008766.1 Flp pilus assembly complex ATPase component [Escherichia coli]HBA7959814.1 Flp pilus assembly complex ATPase component [Escherichia coli]HBA8247386.1 Flp pilus assembly complex ATPase component [Escherichia coli]
MKNSLSVKNISLVEPSDDDINRFFSNKDTIITRKGGAVEANLEQRRVCLVFENGDFLVSPEYVAASSVRFLKEVCIRKGFAIKKTFGVELKLIRTLYELAEKDNEKDSAANVLPMEVVVSNIINECAYMHVSDLHIKIYEHEADIQIRRNGELNLLRQIEANVAHSILAAFYNAAEEADATYRIYAYQAARIVASNARISIPDTIQAIRLQFNPLGQGGRYMIARFLYSDQGNKNTIDPLSLGFHQIHCKQLSFLRKLPIGINIISGPTGSGKSTTLKNMLELLYKEKEKKINIISIEDPPEYEIQGTAQLPITNVDSEAERGIEYRKAMTAALRSDPDVIMPGEARDSEVIRLVFTAAMTGHQVWTSLHANSAMSIFDRLRDQGVDEYKLTDPELITGLAAQRLIKKLCPHCSIELNEHIKRSYISDEIKNVVSNYEQYVHFVNKNGCDFCNKGYVGRTVVAEIIIPDEYFLSLIIQGKRNDALRYWLDHLNGMLMLEHAWIKVVKGEVDLKDAIASFPGLLNLTSERKQKLFCL